MTISARKLIVCEFLHSFLLLNLIALFCIALFNIIIWLDLIWPWGQTKEHVITVMVNLTLCHFWLNLNQFSIAEYIRCQMVTTRNFGFSWWIIVWQRFCFLIGYIQQFYSLIKQSNLFNCKTEKKQNKKKTTTTTVKGKNCF